MPLRASARFALLAAALVSASAFAACGDDGPTNPIAPFDGGAKGDATTATSTRILMLVGTIITPDEVIDGEVLVANGKITCVAKGKGCRDREGADRATVIEAKGVIAPGAIDTHNHILFDVFDDSDWLPEKKYDNHDQWPDEDRYKHMLDVKQCLANDSQGKPDWCAKTPYGTREGNLRCEMDKWGELKGLIAGTTSIVGLPGISSACFGSLARSIDVAQNGFDDDRVQTSAIFPPSDPDAVCGNFADKSAAAFLVHCGEGVDTKSRNELTKLGESNPPGCLYAPQTAITHGVAFTAADFDRMAGSGMKLTWSPKSNVALYGVTTNLPLALDRDIVVSLGPDWSMGGSQNMLDEMRFAREWDQKNWKRLSAKDVVTMGTLNGAKVLALDDRIGKIAEGYVADIAVYASDSDDPYEGVLAARPRDVRLVLVGGVPLYGDAELDAVAPESPGCEKIDICGAPKFLCVATSAKTDKLGQTYAEIKDALEAAMTAADEQTKADGWNVAPLTPLVRCD